MYIPGKPRIANIFFVITVTLINLSRCQNSQVKVDMNITEEQAINTLVGQVTIGKTPYMLLDGNQEKFSFNVDNGEIRTRIKLDRETEDSYTIAVYSQDSTLVEVNIHVLDINDNTPYFPNGSKTISLPESSPQGSKIHVGSVVDRDSGQNAIDRHEIESGNEDNMFELETKSSGKNVLYLDIKIVGRLDYELKQFYDIVIAVYDGGHPQRKGEVTIHINILDVNDNEPRFTHTKYSAIIQENITVGKSILSVSATDSDSGENGKIRYLLDRSRDPDEHFSVNSQNGTLTVNKPLDFEKQARYELKVIARDNGSTPLQTTAVVEIIVENINELPANINLVFLGSNNQTARIPENASIGEYVARISVSDPDSPGVYYSNVNVTLQGGHGFFGLSTQDNVIYLILVKRSLDRESIDNFPLTIVAVDSGNPPLHASKSFTLFVDDVNDNRPQFTQNVYYAEVQERSIQGSSVLTVQATDPDIGLNALVKYRIVDSSDSSSDWFQIDPNTGLITTKNSNVDCEQNPYPRITVVAIDSGIPPLSSTATVSITVRDVNDLQPVFDPTTYSAIVSEDVTVNSCFLTVTATDPDCHGNAQVTYNLSNFSSASSFYIKNQTGQLCLAKSLDYEKQQSYEFTALAIDSGGLDGTAIIKVTVTDVNDNMPIFYPKNYSINVDVTEANQGHQLVTVQAQDADSATNSIIRYSIIHGNENNEFTINQNTGLLSLASNLPREEKVYILEVEATDGTFRSSPNAMVYISVTGASHHPPTFDKATYRFTVEEDVTSRTVVGSVRATVPDTGSRVPDIYYTITDGDIHGFFSIDQLSGDISTNIELDHDRFPFILLNVKAGAGNPPVYGNTQVNISITDVNDNYPQFISTHLEINVFEDQATSTTIYTAHASDDDSGVNAMVKYKFLENPSSKFRIDQVSGEIRLNSRLDYESVTQYGLVICAYDQGVSSLSSSMTLTVHVANVNDNPPEFTKSLYEVDVNETTAINTNVFQVHASDLDLDQVTYSLTESSGSAFGIFATSGFIYLRQGLDREKQDIYMLTIVAKDNNAKPSLLSSTAQVRIRITDANDNNPVFTESQYVFHIQESLPIGTTVGYVSASDKDLGKNAELKYSIVLQQTKFVLNPYTGEITANTIIDREEQSEYSFSISVSDKGIPPRGEIANVKIIVSDINDHPPMFQNSKPIIATVDENKKKGTSVITIVTKDPDAAENGTVSYHLQRAGSVNALHYFEIHPKTGLITTSEVLDFEKQNSYELIVVARDGGTPMRESKETVTVRVNDDNDETPVFSSVNVTFRVTENVRVGSTVAKVEAYDGDSGDNGRVSYYMVAGNVFGLFVVNISTGAIYCEREIDYEESSSHTLGIKAVDNNIYKPRSSLISVYIQVVDVNDNAPKFDRDPVILIRKENLPIGHVIHTFTATDRDSGLNGTVEYILMDQKSSPGLLTLDRHSGELAINKIIDYEQVTQLSLIVQARDQCPKTNCKLHTTITVLIFIQDENDNSPVFSQYGPFSVNENEAVGYPVVNIIAIDSDSNVNNSGYGVVSYEIVDGNHDNKFEIDPKTGLLSIKQELDREKQDRYELNISASDHGAPRRENFTAIVINVNDVNDNAPHFVKSTYQANVTENGNARIRVAMLSANDADIGDNGKLTYFLPAGVADGRFEVDSTTGELTTTVTLDREETRSYIITAYVKDGGNPMNFDTATIIINVTDTNDNDPEFQDKVVHLSIPENTEQSDIHMAVAGDRDTGENARIMYSITDGNHDNMFSIDANTGRLSCKKLDREVRDSYNLTVRGHDLGQPSRHGYCNIIVTVTDQNDNDPEFVPTTYFKTLREDIAIGSMVLQVSATDADKGSNGHVTYSLGNDTDGLFQVDSETGNITTNGAFDREKKSSITFDVIAKDGGLYNIRNATARVTITITDVNDNVPIFQQIPYSKNVSAGTASNRHIIKVTAEDKDDGNNGKIVYSLVQNSGYFRIDSDTGDIYTSQMLNNAALGYHNLPILAADSGSPSLSSTGVVEIHVGPITGITGLRFRNQTYYKTLQEHSGEGTFVQLVSAEFVGSGSGTITYSIVSGNPDTAFRIDSSGSIYVKDSSKLDYEKSPTMYVFIAASSGTIYAYTTLVVELQDINDNAPRFAQDKYHTSTWEEQKINTFVTQVSAMDLDSGQNAEVTYSIVDGDDDGVFDIFPPYSGIIRTRFPLDFETKPSYRLVIEALDHGHVPKSGSCILRIDVVDINDQGPKFPQSPPVNISEGREIGAYVAQVTANDVDKNSILLYDFGSHGNPDDTFSIDRLSGRLTLAKKLDRESRSHYDIGLMVNDSKFTAMTVLRVNVEDVNDNAPLFSQQSYQKTLEELTPANTPVITVNATDADTDINARITYKMDVIQTQGFRIDENTGTIYTTQTVVYNPDQQIILIVKAEDGGVPRMSSVIAVHIQITPVNKHPPVFSPVTYTRSVSENARKGFSIIQVTATDQDNDQELDYSIVSQNPSIPTFQIDQKSGDITLSGSLDREMISGYELVVQVSDRGIPVKSSSASVTITVDDVNDQAPYFEQKSYYKELNESYPSEHVFLSVQAIDYDVGQNADIQYTITSGNDEGIFIVYGKTGDLVIMPNMSLDYEKNTIHKLIVCATDCPQCPQTVRKLSAFVSVTINVTDVNDHTPMFPVPFYYADVLENQTENTKIFQAHAIDKDGGAFGVVSYQLSGTNFFKIHSQTGWISTNVRFDFENLKDFPVNYRYQFRVQASDISGNTAEVTTVIRIKDLDEYDPAFMNEKYLFDVRGDAKPGTIIGKVVALDKDKGEAGRVYYALKYPNDYFDINATTGDIFVILEFSKNAPPVDSPRIKRELSSGDVTLVIEASSGTENSRSSTTVVNVEVDETCDGCKIVALPQGSDGGSQTTIILVVVFVILAIVLIFVIVLLLVRNRFSKKPKTVAHVFEGAFDNGFDFPNDRAPPPYNEVRHTNSENITTPDVSERSHNSASSGRGSVEADDDEEICMINSTSSVLNQSSGFRSKNMPDSGIQDDENTSEPSIQNSKDYLARLGIDTTSNPIKTQNIMQSVESMHQFSDEGGGEDGLDIDYNKLVQIDHEHDTHGSDIHKDLGFHEPEPQHGGSLSNVINSEEEYSGSYNWDYLLDWGPQYQPLADVFSEIARLKDDNIQPKKQPVRTVPQRINHTSLKPQVKMYPPPVITNAPPVEVVQQTANRSSHGGSNRSARTTSTMNTPNHGSSNRSARTTSTMNTSLPSMPRSPISYESSFTSPALTPSFTPSLSPLGTRSPSISPVVSAQGIGSSGHNTPRQQRLGSNGRLMLTTSSESEQELRI